MATSQETVSTLVYVLSGTLDANLARRKQASLQLDEWAVKSGYAMLLLCIADQANCDFSVKLAAAVTLKNFCKQHWRQTEHSDIVIAPDERAEVKATIVEIMLRSPNKRIQETLGEAIVFIGREDFPFNWPGLLESMVAKFQTGDFNIINGVLRTAHSLFRRYRYEFKSQKLWEEIDFVQQRFALPLTKLFDATMTLRAEHLSNKESITVIYSSLFFIIKIFCSLSSQDVLQVFEETTNVWMGHFLTLLTAPSCPLLVNKADAETAGPEEMLRGQVCQTIAMYAGKYDCDDEYLFVTHIPNLSAAVWQLLVNTGAEKKYDLVVFSRPSGFILDFSGRAFNFQGDGGLESTLVSHALTFLRCVASRPKYRSLFEQEGALKTICEQIVLPNMTLRDCDVSDFLEEPESFIKFDLEGSDLETRRRAAGDLLRELATSFEKELVGYFGAIIPGSLQEYAANPSGKWRSKDVVIHLCSSLAMKAQTQRQGITQSSELINVPEFYTSHILPELSLCDINDPQLIIKADSIKFTTSFRNQLPTASLHDALPRITTMLSCPAQVIHTYAAHAIDRLLVHRAPASAGDASPTFTAESLKPHAELLLTSLLRALDHEGSEENEYVMKAIMRAFVALERHVVPYLESIMQVLNARLVMVAKNPRKPHFNHYLFETICVALKQACIVDRANVVSFEQALLGTFGDILTTDVQDFIPYVFQILSLMLDQHERGAMPGHYLELFPHLLLPDLWSRNANIPALVRLLDSIIENGGSQIPNDKMTGLLGVWQKLLSSKMNDHFSFRLLSSLLQFMPPEMMSGYWKAIFSLLFQRLSSSKTSKYAKGLIVFLCLFASKTSSDRLLSQIDDLQPRLFVRVVEKLMVADLQRVSGNVEKKIVCAGLTELLCSPKVVTEYEQCWVLLMGALISLFEKPVDNSTPDDEHFIDIDDSGGFETVYSRLTFAGDKENDPIGAVVSNVKEHLVRKLQSTHSAQHGPKIRALVQQLPPDQQNVLQTYSAAAGIQL